MRSDSQVYSTTRLRCSSRFQTGTRPHPLEKWQAPPVMIRAPLDLESWVCPSARCLTNECTRPGSNRHETFVSRGSEPRMSSWFPSRVQMSGDGRSRIGTGLTPP